MKLIKKITIFSILLVAGNFIAPLSALAAENLGEVIDWYDCSGHTDGNYEHPTDCTKFIRCVEKTHAYEMSCGTNPDGGSLNYNAQTGECDSPESAGCGMESDPSDIDE